MRKRYERRTRNCHRKFFRKVWTIYLASYIKNVNQKMNFYDSDEIELRLPFYRSFSTFWNIFGGLCTHVFYSSTWGKR